MHLRQNTSGNWGYFKKSITRLCVSEITKYCEKKFFATHALLWKLRRHKKLSNCHSTLMVTSAMGITFTLQTHGDVRWRLLWKLLSHCRSMVTSAWACNENYLKFSLFYEKNAIFIIAQIY